MINPELSIVALCIKYPDMIPVVRTSVMGRMFTNTKYATIYKACLKLKDNNKLVDSVTYLIILNPIKKTVQYSTMRVCYIQPLKILLTQKLRQHLFRIIQI